MNKEPQNSQTYSLKASPFHLLGCAVAMPLMVVGSASGGYVSHRGVLLMLKSCPIQRNKCKLFGV